MIAAGTYKAKPIGGAFDKNSKGNLACAIQFEFTEETAKGHKMWWVGYLTPSAMENTMRQLAYTGLSNSPKTDENGRFDASQFIDPNKELELVVSHEEYEGKTRPRIQWVNEIGGGKKFGNLDQKSLSFELSSVNFAAEIMAAKQKLGIKTEVTKTQLKNHAPQASPPPFDNNEEIPF